MWLAGLKFVWKQTKNMIVKSCFYFQTSAKKVRLTLEADLKTDLSHRKEEIGKLIQAVIDEMDDDEDEDDDEEEEEEEEEEPTPKKNGAVKNGNGAKAAPPKKKKDEDFEGKLSN